MTRSFTRLVLRPEFGEHDFKLVVWDLFWDLLDLGRQEDGAVVDSWLTPDGGAEVHYVDDRITGMRYVTIRGDGAAGAEAELRPRCRVWTLDEALSALREASDRNEQTEGTDRNDRLVALYAAALTAEGPEDRSLVEAFAAAARDGDPGIRQAVVVATGYLPWPGLVALVKELSRTDPVDHVRHNARVLLEGLARTEGDS
ncbi:HEAT repeat domain-containing protein [Kitasatospora sp. NPDC057965]|uniref:HEAT repeat domain-containing protein n=1 Tax=Kitasatospora sp. NPDC057965 TaxID=3346291 RepID=UPI0036DCAEF0